MDNVLKALKHMAEHGYWCCVSHAGTVYLSLLNARSLSYDGVWFTQDEIREFLEHYDEVTRDA